LKKKKATVAATFFTLLQGNGEFAFLLWFCYKEGDNINVVTFLYGGDFTFSLCYYLCFYSLELTIGNNWWFLV